jgi:hypothetical protein
VERVGRWKETGKSGAESTDRENMKGEEWKWRREHMAHY